MQNATVDVWVRNITIEQLAELWQRDRAKLDSFSINVQLYSLNHKIAFLATL